MDDCLILGGGVIGLSLAWELAQHGQRVRVIDRRSPGEEASWAGAGILPPSALRDRDDSARRLAGLSYELHPEWARRLREETGIDTGFRRCGGVYLANSPHGDDLRAMAEACTADGVRVEQITPAQLADIEPALADGAAGRRPLALHLPDEAQLRNPRHLRALLTACVGRGVTLSSGIEAEDFLVTGNRVTGVRTSAGVLAARTVCLAGGAWSRMLAERLGVRPAIKPIRGQMVLLQCDRPPLKHVVNVGPRYLVPRDDGHVLVGSTEEDVGFDRRTTATGVEGLLEFAIALAPRLAAARFDRCWSGFRPGTADGLPYLGAVPGLENAFIAAGHHRSGLTLSPATAVVMSQLIRGEQPTVDLAPFGLARG